MTTNRVCWRWWPASGLALLGGMGLHDFLMHLGAGAAVLVAAFRLCDGLGRRRRCQGGGWVALWFGFESHELSDPCVAVRGALTLLLQFRQWPLPYPLTGQARLLRLHDRQSGSPTASRSRSARSWLSETDQGSDLAHLAMR
jgi:prepilin peptidase CpaA